MSSNDVPPPQGPDEFDGPEKMARWILDYHKAWMDLNSPGGPPGFAEAFSLPLSEPALRRVLGLAYHTSMSPEEGRFPHFTIICRRHEGFWSYAAIDVPIKDVEDLRRLAPTCIEVDHALSLREIEGGLHCAGLVTSNPSVRTAGDLAPRKLGHGLAIEIRIQGPGHLVAQWLGEEIELRAGTLRHVTGFLRLPVFRKLIDETSQYLVPAPVSSGQAEIKQIFRFVLSRMIRQTMNRRHGGCFVILPDRDYAADIAVGYRCENSVSLVRSVQEFWDANRTAGNTLAPSPPEDANRMAEWAWQKLLAIGDTIDRASCVDGCVVLTRDLRLRGFGGHIAIRDDDPDLLRRPLRDEVTRDVLADVTGGTRHRSALRLCRKIAGAMALVISQDGYLTAYWSDDDAAHCVGNLAAADPFDG